MNKRANNLRRQLMLFTACTMVGTALAAAPALAQTTTTTTPSTDSYKIKKITIQYKKLLLKEKDLPSAVSHITQEQIQAQGSLGSIQSVLRETPSVNEYQSGAGQSVPVLTVRGVRLYETAETLDGNPMSDILSGGQGGFLDNNVGSPVVLDQLGDTEIFPGIAPPVDQGFGSGGATIAYTTKDPTMQKSAEIFGSYGSFDTSDAGFTLNTGTMNGQPDGARALLQYDQGYTHGFDDDTDQRDGNFMFKIIKPYNNGFSHISATVIYNRAFGYINTAPLPLTLIQQNSFSYNFPKSLTFTSENNGYLTAHIDDDTFVNQYLDIGASLFYNRTTQTFLSYQNPNSINYSPAFPYQITFQVPYFSTGAIGPTAGALGVATVGNPTYGTFTYDPLTFYPGGVAAAIASGAADSTAAYAYGEAAELNNSVTNTIGFTPHATILLTDNTIKIGGLIAKENSGGTSYIWGDSDVPQQPANETSDGGGAQRSVYQMYGQDTIDLLNDKLHISPSITVVGAYTSAISNESFNYPPEKLENFNSIAEPYLGVSYDLPYHTTLYASYGKGGYFAPISDYADNDINGTLELTSQRPEVIHQYEAGVRYDTSKALLNFDAFYQKISDADSFFVNYATGAADYGNFGSEQFRGYEADGKYFFTPWLDIFGNASYNDARYLNSYFANDTPFEDQYGYVFKGDPLASVPNWLANFGIDVDKDNFGAHLSENYTGSQPITYDFSPALTYTGPNITNNPGCSEGSPYPNECLALATVPDSKNQALIKELIGGSIPFMTQPGFLVSNLLLTYDMPLKHEPIQKLHFELNIQNLFDAHYVSHLYSSYAEIPDGHGGYAITSEYTSAFYGPPRSITVAVSAKF